MNNNQHMNQKNAISSDYLSLFDVLLFFKTSLVPSILSSMLCGMLGGLYAYYATPKYEASAFIQVAKVANIEVEPALLLAEKLKLPSFYSHDTIIACKLDNLSEPRLVLVGNLKPSLVKNTSIITFSMRQTNIEISKQCLESVLKDIQNNHFNLAKPLIEIRKNELENSKAKLLELEQNFSAIFSSKNMNFDFNDAKFSASALLYSTLLTKESEAKDLRALIRDLEISLTEPQTQQAHLIAPIYASTQEVEPKRIPIIVGNILFGFFVPILFFLFRTIWLKSYSGNK